MTFFLFIFVGSARGETSSSAESGLSLNFQNTDIDLVLKFFSDVTGKIFVKSDLVRGFVTIMAPGRVTIEEAMRILQTVLEVKGFTLVPGTGNVVKILSQAEALQTNLEVGQGGEAISLLQGDRMMTQVVPLKFVSGQELKGQLSPLVSKGGNLIADERTNAFVITDMASNIQRLLKIIQELDVRSPQVLIEALIVEVSLTKEAKLGLEWSRAANFSKDGHRYAGTLSQGFSLPSFVTEGLKYSVIRDDQNLSGLLQALATDKNVNILSTPHILTVNNQPATIRVGEEVPVLTQKRNIQGGETIRSFDFKSVAIELEVTPRINPEREVYLKVHPLVKKILGFNAELNAPILASREAQTSVLIKDGQTVVIGGLMKDDRSSNQSKIPILGDIPILGYLFKKKGTTKEKTELLVFITPRVILNPEEARAVTREKEGESKAPQTPYRMKAREHYRLGRFFYRQGQYADAIREWERVLQLSPDEKLKRKANRLIKKTRKQHNRNAVN